MALVGVGIVAALGWLSLIILTRIDELVLPGELNLGGLSVVPGVEEPGEGPTERLNVLVMGIDRRPTEGNIRTRTDTMFVVTIDPVSDTAGILGIPRDLWVTIPESSNNRSYSERINAAYVFGGPELAMETVELNLGIKIDHYLTIDFEGFKRIIDEMGGITIYIEQDVYDPYYSDTERRGDYFPLDFTAGETVHMDGKTALGYARTRRNSSDFDRIRRQQQVIFAALDKAGELGLSDVGKIPSLWNQYKNAIQTDINDLLVLRFAGLAGEIDTSRIAALSIGVATVPWTTPQGAAVLRPDAGLIQDLIEALFSDNRLQEENAQVEVQNGAGADGLATEAVNFLAGQGFPSGALTAADAADGRIRPNTEIIDFSGKEYSVERLADLLGVSGDWMRRATAGDDALRTVADADIVVILGTGAQDGVFSGEPAAGG